MTKMLIENNNINTPLMENMIYMLCGIDTSYLSIGMRNKKYALMSEENYPIEYLSPFEEICINVRIVHKFIYKNISIEGSLKKLISEYLLKCKKNYLLKIGRSRYVRDIETLYVIIHDDINSFKDYRFIVDACRTSDESEIYTKIQNIIDKPSFTELRDMLQTKITNDVVNWILKGEISPSFFVEKNDVNYENVEEGFWKSNYFIKNIESLRTKENFDILQCGKLVNLIKNIDNNVKLDLEEDFMTTRGIQGTLHFLNELTFNILKNDLKYEISVLENYIFMNDMSFFNDLFIDLYNDRSFNISNDFSVHSDENRKFILKINLFKKIDILNFKMADLDLNNTIYQIYNTELQFKNNQSILEFITVEFNPKVLKLLLTRKNFLELELIFRFLFTISVIQFFLQKFNSYRFSKLVLCFIQNFKFSIYSNLKDITFENVDGLVNNIEDKITRYLNNLFLVSSETFLVLSEIIDLSFNFISLDRKEECINIQDFEGKFVVIISKLYGKLKNTNCYWWFLNTLECLMDENYFRK